MTFEEYFEGLGCSPDEVQVCASAARARWRRQMGKAARTFSDAVRKGFVSHGDPDDRVRSRAASEDKEARGWT